jgi:hypothetical protein
VYAGAWAKIVRAIEAAHRCGIGVLIGQIIFITSLIQSILESNDQTSTPHLEIKTTIPMVEHQKTNGRHNPNPPVLIYYLRQLEFVSTNVVGIELLN